MTMAVMGFFLRFSGRWLHGVTGATSFAISVVPRLVAGGVAGQLLIVTAAAGDVSVPSGRFEFAPVPEHVFVTGVAETVQLGIRQIDPGNRWRAGDQTRASGWT